MLVLAHAAHWYTAAIYLAPFAVVAGFVVRDNLRRRRAGGSRDSGEGR